MRKEAILALLFIKPIWIAIVFSLPFWGCYVVRNRLNLAYSNCPLGFSIYFLMCSLLGIWFFHADLARAPIGTTLAIPAIILLFTLLLTGAIYASGKKRLPDVDHFLQQYSPIYNKWVMLDYRYLVVNANFKLVESVQFSWSMQRGKCRKKDGLFSP